VPTSDLLDLLVVGAGPTGIAIGAEARRAGLDVLLVDRGPLTAAIQAYPTFLEFFTTRERLEIADIPFTIPEAKPTRRDALAYYRAVVERYGVPLALYEEVLVARREGEEFAVETAAVRDGRRRTRRARAVAIATGYFFGPQRLGVPGEDLPWVRYRYVEPYPHYGQDVVVVGAGNTAAEAALDLWRNGARVTLVHRRSELKGGVKYWLKPDLENRIEEGSIRALFDSLVCAFRPDGTVEVRTPAGPELLPAQAAYVLGPERGSLSAPLLERCDYVVRIPTNFCVNLAMAGAIVMYDRVRSLGRFAPRPVREGGSAASPVRNIAGKVGRKPRA